MPEPELLTAFRFRISLVRSAAGGSGTAATTPVGASASASANATASASASASFNASAGVSLGASAGVNAGASGSASASAGASFGASASAALGAGGSIGAGGGSILGNGAFAECSGLDLEMDVQEYLEGGRNDAVIRRAGRVKLQPIVLKRGMVYPPGGGADNALWRWMQDVVSGVRPIPRYDGVVEVMNQADVVKARWTFSRGLPLKVSGAGLNARTGEIAMEELHIAHEGLRMVAI